MISSHDAPKETMSAMDWVRPGPQPQVTRLSLMLLALVANVDCFGMTVPLDSLIHVEEIGGGGEFPKLAEAIVARVELRGLLDDIATHSTQMSPSTLIGGRLHSASEKSDQFTVSFQLICRFGFHG